jgi:Pilus assembly protein, PilO
VKLTRPFPKGVVVGGIVGAGLLVAVVGWLLVVAPQKHKAADLDKQAASVQQQIAENLQQIASAKNTVPVPLIRVADVYKLAKAMPSSTDAPNLLIELDQVAKDSGVELQTIAPTRKTDGSMLLSLTVGGDFFTITDLLYRLRNLVFVRHGALEATGPLFSVDTVGLSPIGKNGLTASITLHTSVYAPAAATVPVVPVVPSTDTTATTPDTSSGSPSAAGAP